MSNPVTKFESLLEFVIVKKYARVFFLKKDQAHLLELRICRQELLDRSRNDLRRFGFGISVGAGRD